MFARQLIGTVAAAIVWGTALPGHCDPASRAAIMQAYQAADAAASNKDANGASSRFGDTRLRNQASASLSGLFRAVSSPNFTTRILAFSQPSGNHQEAIVIIRQHFQGLLTHPRTKSSALIASDGKFREYWAVTGGQWHTMRSRLLSIQKTMNGHAVKSW